MSDENVVAYPSFLKWACVLFILMAGGCILYLGQPIILPLVYAIIVSILLNPFVNFLVRKKMNRTVAIFVAVLVSIFFTLGIVYFISLQVSLFSDSYPQLKQKFTITNTQLIGWFSAKFGIKTTVINGWIQSMRNDAMNNMSGTIGNTLYTLNGVLISTILIPVYIVMILFYKNLLLEFIHKIVERKYRTTAQDILVNSKNIIQSYLVGLLMEAFIIAVLNSVGLLLLGIDYAIILGITGALLNIIPYIGGVIAIALPMIIAFVTKDSLTYPFLVLLIYLCIQFIDNHFIIPRIVASKVKLNALVSVIVVLVGSAFWGIPGMFLSIPLTAILKVIFDHIDSLKPWGILLGNRVPVTKYRFYKASK